MRALKLMADYQCFPLWEASPGEFGNVDPESLPISPSLKAELLEWAELFDKTLNEADPKESGFRTVEEEEVFRRKGRALAERLQRELGPGYAITLQLQPNFQL